VTDWEYYYAGEDDPDERMVVQPNPFDESQPRRTRSSSGSVVRIFRGEMVGLLGSCFSAQGLDKRVLIKEYMGESALDLAECELLAVSELQSNQFLTDRSAKKGDWTKVAASRSSKERQDNANVAVLCGKLGGQSGTFSTVPGTPFLGILGEVNMAELDGEMDPNEFYRALGVRGPNPSAIWVVYEYAGLSTVQSYTSVPLETRRSRLPIKKGFFGNVIPAPELPPWRERAKYVTGGILKQSLKALAHIHQSGLVHRSIGRSSFIVSSSASDKQVAVSPYATLSTSCLLIKLSDFGFATKIEEATYDDEFVTRARTFGLSFEVGECSPQTKNFAIAEDMHALGFVALGLLLVSLAEIPSPSFQLPATDEDTLQRLFGDIFESDIFQLRDYLEAEDVWSKLVDYLDEDNKAGWKVLESLLLAREKAAAKESEDLQQLLKSVFFADT